MNRERNFALIGCPLGHSLSPQIHEKLFKLADMPFHYELTEIKPEELSSKYDYLDSLYGFNITIPHKIPIIKYCSKLDETAARYGSVNCVKNGEEKVGYNTDVIGFTKSIEMLGASLRSNVVLLGCGGVGRMMALETAYSGGSLTIAVREDDLGEAVSLMKKISQTVPGTQVKVTFLNKLEGEFDLMINATPVGMYPKTDAMPVSPDVLGGVKYLFDAVYNPLKTKLIKEAEERGVKAMGGMAMLVLQAAAAHEIWDNSVYSDKDISAIIEETEKLI